ncbi:MAG: FtsW/RodA/SpoVE family cell cycle protein [Verrucomicrobiaceae bacterium]|nr:FtsW/RodA/SpoVE family cell cycle protein [Verrucomicrobiaceae bacterium]
MTPLFKKFLGINWIIMINMLALMAFGVYAIYNATYFRDELWSGKWREQMHYALMGIPIVFIVALTDYRWVRWACIPLYLLGIAGLIALELYGIEIKGNKAWINIAGRSVQPSQIAMLAGIVTMAVVFGELPRIWSVFRRPWLRLMVAGLLAGVPAAMVIKEDLGSGLVWGPVFLSMMLVGSIPFRYMIVLIQGVMCVVPLVYVFALKDYQKDRINTAYYMLTNQEEKVDRRNEGYVANYMQIAVASAGLEGKGPLSVKVPDQKSVHHTFFPNEGANDFIFSVIAEEFGFRGTLMLLSFLALLLFQIVFVAFYARDQLGRLLAVGVGAMFFAHTFQHAGMNLNMLPIIGIPLPFISAGGTFLLVSMFMMGLVQSVWVHRNISAAKKKPGAGGGWDDADDDDD